MAEDDVGVWLPEAGSIFEVTGLFGAATAEDEVVILFVKIGFELDFDTEATEGTEDATEAAGTVALRPL